MQQRCVATAMVLGRGATVFVAASLTLLGCGDDSGSTGSDSDGSAGSGNGASGSGSAGAAGNSAGAGSSGGAICGGFAGFVCGDDEYCAYQAGQYCGAADASATCQRRPDACADIYMPVCGCDGVTYSNSCSAAAAGTGVLDEGECG